MPLTLKAHADRVPIVGPATGADLEHPIAGECWGDSRSCQLVFSLLLIDSCTQARQQLGDGLGKYHGRLAVPVYIDKLREQLFSRTSGFIQVCITT